MATEISEQQRVLADYQQVRQFTERLVEPLTPEDCVIQSMPDVSPTRWHLAHTTWFFETFVLARKPGYEAFDPDYAYLFNSYYNSIGSQFPRPQRGLLSRPGLAEICDYRQYVDAQIAEQLRDDLPDGKLLKIIELGLQHEQQHQELMLTDIKHVLSCNPLLPAYRPGAPRRNSDTVAAAEWVEFDEGLRWIGYEGDGFSFDNEGPRHRVWLDDFALSSRPVDCDAYVQFIEDGGYRRAELWLSMGWNCVQEQGWEAPLYWLKRDGQWHQFTLAGLLPIEGRAPVCHVSYFEADAFARWAGACLPTEAEWETAAEGQPIEGNFADVLLEDDATLHPSAHARNDGPLQQMFGDVWEWTASPYVGYPGYRPAAGALGEYNGKFMCNQFVLRGGSVASSRNHLRRTYRNFFPPDARWQFSGLRVKKE